MKQLSGLLSCLVASSTWALVSADFPVPKYVLDLDAPASERWSPLMQDILELRGWDASFGPVVKFMTNLVPLADWEKNDLELQGVGIALFGLEYFEEIRGVHKKAVDMGFGKKITAGMLVFLQLFYELMMECTGVIARDTHGNVVHGRNMDISLQVANLTAQVTWVKGGKEVLVTTQYLGYLGVHTGMRINGWSVQTNERLIIEPGPWGWQKTVLAHDILSLLKRATPVGYLLRESLLSAATFDEAIQTLSAAKAVSPLYFIVAGAKAGEGAVITRDRDGRAKNPRSLIRLSNQSWNIVQTNWDNWIPFDEQQCKAMVANFPERAKAACLELTKLVYGDDGGCEGLCSETSDGRAEAARASMAHIGSPAHVDAATILSVMSTPPVLAGGTQFTSIMNPGANTYTTFARTHGSSGEVWKENSFLKLRRDQFLKEFAEVMNHGRQIVV